MKRLDLALLTLQTHAKVLEIFCEQFTADIALKVLERLENPPDFTLNGDLLEKFTPPEESLLFPEENTFETLDSWVASLLKQHHLPKSFEFYLWSFPLYRYLIEDEADLQQDFVFSPLTPNSAKIFVQNWSDYYTDWVKAIGLHDPFLSRVLKAIEPIQRKLRSQLFQTLHLNPLKLITTQ